VTDRLLDAVEVAALLSVPTSWVRQQARDGAIPCVRLGRYVRFEREAVLEWVASCRQPGRPVELRRYAPTNGGSR
jgi:excisionase family DNA binding protein